MHLPFIEHTRARQIYVITCTRLKRVFRFISCRIVLVSVQDDGDGCKSTSKDELPQPRGSLANNIPSHAIEQANQEFQQDDTVIVIHNMRQIHSNFRIFKFRVLFNFVYQII